MNVSLACATHLHFACHSFLSFSFLLPLLSFHFLFPFSLSFFLPAYSLLSFFCSFCFAPLYISGLLNVNSRGYQGKRCSSSQNPEKFLVFPSCCPQVKVQISPCAYARTRLPQRCSFFAVTSVTAVCDIDVEIW